MIDLSRGSHVLSPSTPTLSASWCYHVCHAPCLYTEINTHTFVPLNLHTHTENSGLLLHLPPSTTHTLKTGLECAIPRRRIQCEARRNKAARIAALATRCNVQAAGTEASAAGQTPGHVAHRMPPRPPSIYIFLIFPDIPSGWEERGGEGAWRQEGGGWRVGEVRGEGRKVGSSLDSGKSCLSI